MNVGMRRSIYLSPLKDKDIINYITPIMEKHSFSHIVKELIREGIAVRRKVPKEKEACSSLFDTSTKSEPDFTAIELKPKTLTDTDLEDRLDSF